MESRLYIEAWADYTVLRVHCIDIYINSIYILMNTNI
jgi:hypothetical protein